jgi:hypothetical protein
MSVVVFGALLALAAVPAMARPGPKILNARFAEPPVAGAPASLVVTVRDPLAAINGIQVDFGDGSTLKISACRPETPFSGPLPDVFKAGRPVTFPIEHRYASAGKMTVRIVAISGDCATGRAVSALDTNVRVLDAVRPPGGPKIPDGPKLPLARIAAGAPCPEMFDVPGSAGVAATRRGVLCLIGFVRQVYGLSPLRSNKKLTRAAQGHAKDMVARNYFAHESPEGRALIDRLRRARFKLRGSAGENIGAGSGPYSTPLGVVLGWFESPPHRANMLEPSFTRVGIGVSAGMPGESAPDAGTYDLTLAAG